MSTFFLLLSSCSYTLFYIYRLKAKSVLNMITETIRQVCVQGVKISTSVEIYNYKAVSSDLHKVLTIEYLTLESILQNVQIFILPKKSGPHTIFDIMKPCSHMVLMSKEALMII
jgi:repressor of nif and glnA expression